MILLIHPPVVKPCEPPAGIGVLCGALRQHGIGISVLDANLEGILFLLRKSSERARPGEDRWTARARRGLDRHLEALRSFPAYRSPDRYRRAVADLGRLLERNEPAVGVRVGLGNIAFDDLRPVRSSDLLRAAEEPETNPFYPYFSGRIRQCIERDVPSALGFSLNYLSQAVTTFAMIGFARRSFPGLPIVVGGGLVTSWLSRPGWRNPFGGLVDCLIAGPGEGPLLSLLSAPALCPSPTPCHSEQSGESLSLLKINSEKNLVITDNSKPEILRLASQNDIMARALAGGDKGEGVCIDGLPPDYGDFPLLDYLSPGVILPYSAARGCPWRRCRFCPERAEGNPYRPISPERAISDLKTLTRKVEPVLIHLLDNAVSPALLEALWKAPPGAPWYGFARITEHLTDADFCRALKRSGCAMLKLGLESGDQEVLDGLEKGIDLAVASRALRTLREAGIPTYVYLLFGTPVEKEASAHRTLAFIADHRDFITFLNIAVFNLPIFADPSLHLETRGFYEGDLSLYTDFVHPHGWDRSRVRTFLDRDLRRHPAVKPILRRDPPVFTSNHAPFFTGLFAK